MRSDHFSYRTIARPSEGQYKEKGSRFLGFALPVASEAEIRDKIGYDYAATPEVMRQVKEFDLRIEQQTFETQCELKGDYKIRDRSRFFEKLESMMAMGVKLTYA